MYRLFTDTVDQNNSVVKFSEFDYIKRTYLREIADIEDYYHNRVYAVKSNHFLANILRHINVPMQYPADQYVNVAMARTPYIATGFKMTSSLSRGQLFDGVFYGAGSTEILLSSDEYFNPYDAEQNWKTLCPVKVLLHPKSDMSLLLPNGKKSGSGDGLSVISINIPLLALQYRSFVMDQSVKRNIDAGGLDISHFIHMYVLPNMVAAQTDISVMNRLINLYYGAPMGTPYLKHAFPIVNYGYKVDQVLNKVIISIKQKNLKYSWLLKLIPSIAAEDMQESLIMPEFAPTRQIQWAITLSRLDYIRFIIDIGGERSLGQNRTDINILQRSLTHLLNENILDSILPENMLYDYRLIIDELLAL